MTCYLCGHVIAYKVTNAEVNHAITIFYGQLWPSKTKPDVSFADQLCHVEPTSKRSIMSKTVVFICTQD